MPLDARTQGDQQESRVMTGDVYSSQDIVYLIYLNINIYVKTENTKRAGFQLQTQQLTPRMTTNDIVNSQNAIVYTCTPNLANRGLRITRTTIIHENRKNNGFTTSLILFVDGISQDCRRFRRYIFFFKKCS